MIQIKVPATYIFNIYLSATLILKMKVLSLKSKSYLYFLTSTTRLLTHLFCTLIRFFRKPDAFDVISDGICSELS